MSLGTWHLSRPEGQTYTHGHNTVVYVYRQSLVVVFLGRKVR